MNEMLVPKVFEVLECFFSPWRLPFVNLRRGELKPSTWAEALHEMDNGRTPKSFTGNKRVLWHLVDCIKASIGKIEVYLVER